LNCYYDFLLDSLQIKKYNSISPNGYNISIGGEFVNIMIGENHPRNTISNEILLKIINDLSKNQLSDRDIAKKYGTTDKIVADINHGYSHHQDNLKYPIRIKKGLQKINQNQLELIIDMLKNTNLTYQQIADKFNLSKGTIYHINKGLTFHFYEENYPLRKKG
jgi:Trp operon repressor